jgi:hypothetical protein
LAITAYSGIGQQQLDEENQRLRDDAERAKDPCDDQNRDDRDDDDPDHAEPEPRPADAAGGGEVEPVEIEFHAPSPGLSDAAFSRRWS